MIIADKISKSFDGVCVLDKISLKIRKGETAAIIGLNGSGKTTLLKILAGIISVDEGYLRVNSKELKEIHCNRKFKIAYSGFGWSNMNQDGTVKEMIELCKKMFHVSEEYSKYVLKHIKSYINIDILIEKQMTELSTGEKSKIEFLYSLLICPDLWIMDEPTLGVDYETRNGLYTIIKHFKNREEFKNTTIIIATHNMQEMEAISDKVFVLSNSKIIFSGPMDKLQEKYRNFGLINFEVENGNFLIQDMPIKKYQIEGNRVKIIYNKSFTNAGTVLKQFAENSVLRNIKVTEIDLETMIKNIFLQ